MHSAAIALFTLPLFAGTGCAGLHTTPDAATSATRSDHAPATAAWGVSDSGYSGDPSTGPYLYAICNGKIYNAPSQPNPSCYEGAPTLFGVKKVTGSDSFGPATCGTDPGNCSSSIALASALGVIEQSTAVSVVEHSQMDQLETAEGTASMSSWADRVTPKSPTLPQGTNVRVQETVTITGTFNANCSQYAQIVYNGVTAFGRGLNGSCINGKFQQYLGDPSHPGTKVVYAITLKVGDAEDITSSLFLQAYAIDCVSMPFGCAKYAAQSVSANAATLTEHFKPLTANVTLHFASGHSYK